MNILLSLFFSLFLTTLVSFTTPVIFCLFVLAVFVLMSHLPLIGIWGENLYEGLWHFLAIFGEGSGSIGILTIGVVCGIVGFLFESLNFYRYNILINHSVKTSWNPTKAPEIIAKIIYHHKNN